MSGEWPGALLARRTRTIGMCSSDARRKGQPWPLPLREVRKESEGVRLRNGASWRAGAGRVKTVAFLSILRLWFRSLGVVAEEYPFPSDKALRLSEGVRREPLGVRRKGG